MFPVSSVACRGDIAPSSQRSCTAASVAKPVAGRFDHRFPVWRARCPVCSMVERLSRIVTIQFNAHFIRWAILQMFFG